MDEFRKKMKERAVRDSLTAPKGINRVGFFLLQQPSLVNAPTFWSTVPPSGILSFL